MPTISHHRRFESLLRFAVLIVLLGLALWTLWLVRSTQIESVNNLAYEGRFFAENVNLVTTNQWGNQQVHIRAQKIESERSGKTQVLRLTQPLLLAAADETQVRSDVQDLSPWRYWVQANRGELWAERVVLREAVHLVQLAQANTSSSSPLVNPVGKDKNKAEHAVKTLAVADLPKQPVHIESQQMTMSKEERGEGRKPLNTSVFKGDVSLRQGQTLITADEVHYRQEDERSAITALGNPQQRVYLKRVSPPVAPSKADEWVEGTAERMEYDSANEVAVLIGQATVKKWRDGTVVDELHGERIVYDAKQQLISAQARGEGVQDGKAKSRIRAVITPE